MAFDMNDPKTFALMQLASGLMAGGAPSYGPPKNLLGVLGGAGPGALHSFMVAKQQQEMDEYRKLVNQGLRRDLNAPPPLMNVPPGGSIFDPSTRAPVFTAPNPQRPMVVGDALIDPANPQQPLYKAPDKPQPTPSSITEYNFAKGQGYKGTFQDFVVEQKKAGAAQVTQTVGAKEADKKFAEEFIPFATGGFADAQKQVAQLREVSASLNAIAKGKSDKSLTGPVVGSIPEWLRPIAAPESQAAQDAVEEVVQRNLRLILGAQFTEKEGARLVARAYNPKLGEAENAKRVDRLIGQIEQAAQAKLEASQYFMAHGTLDGWRGKLWTMNDFNPESGPAKIGGPKKGDVVDGWEFVGGDPSSKMNWRKK